MNSVPQEQTEVKPDIDTLMAEKCLNCRIRGYISIGGIGNDIVAKCHLCDYTWNPNNLSPYGCGCVLPEQSCPDCEAAARVIYDDEELPF